ncbi:unnamed protein product [Thelazia callipaeda]|uniref:Letm1 RBD domain-containing protein n=1 Tax=Thelazia callipaeda TaxID=103827 RepID=A0A0N5CMT7_THECL|nr:unnamed protein product [Thelazia callipaeda]
MLIKRNIHGIVNNFKLTTTFELWLKNEHVTLSPITSVSAALTCRQLCSNVEKQPKGLMTSYEAFLSRRYPKAYVVHKMVINGCKWCWSDIKTYYQLKNDLRTNVRKISQLKRSELEILLQMKEELLKVAIIVIFIPIPFTIYIFALAVIFFPRLILTRHFWTNDQRKRFWAENLQRTSRVHVHPLQKYLQGLNVDLQTPLERLRELVLPQMSNCSIGHLYHLSRLHRVSFFVHGIRGLHARAEMLRLLDQTLKFDDSAIDAMEEQQLYQQFFLRRLQYDGLSEVEMKSLLKNWVQHMTGRNYSNCQPIFRILFVFEIKARFKLIHL